MDCYQLLTDLQERSNRIANRLKQLEDYNRHLTQRHQALKERLEWNAAQREAALEHLKKRLGAKK